ncbi:MAG: hypothetical protein Q8933_00060 [Bacteroidota bacterium]|nr:hypothetical protein [Bacteroidota bacterium]MDP4190027.1 hypothetical protein [Bacteroidota bacterium]MDP4193459.1 hypothetical protein [Bacteroidota bacterium]
MHTLDKFKLSFFFIIVSLFTLPLGVFAQWNNDPLANKVLASDTKNPINITTVSDQNGGGFVFWEDKVDSSTSNLYFQHFTADGTTDFPSYGKPVSQSSSHKTAPISATSTPLSAVIIYKDFGGDKNGELYAQRVSSKGELLWTNYGIKLTDHEGESQYPYVTSDNMGNVFVTYIYRDFSTPANYKVYVQKIKPSGETAFTSNGMLVAQSARIKSNPKIAGDNKGGMFVFWVESVEGKARLYVQHIDANGKNTWSNKTVQISRAHENILNYSVLSVAGNSAYVNWEVKNGTKDIYQQLISIDGKFLWTKEGEKLTNQYGSQTSPQEIYTPSGIIVSWINEISNDKDIFMQKFNLSGKPQWSKDGIAVIRFRGNQMSQRMIADQNSGAIIAWLDMRVKAQKGNIFAQRISNDGRRLWDSTGIEIASNLNSEKSYLSLLPNKINGAVAIFKENRAKQSNIYGQRILGNGKFNFDILGFRAVLDNGTVRASWETINESGNKGFYVERVISDSNWQQVKFIPGKNNKGANNYEFSEVKPAKGTIFYRLSQIDEDGNQQRSNIVKLDDFSNRNTDNFALDQNFPNPFSDSTTIKYILPERCKVTLGIYNDRLEAVSIPVDEVQEKGEYSVSFNTLSSRVKLKNGVYFYRLKAGDFVSVKKMVVTK